MQRDIDFKTVKELTKEFHQLLDIELYESILYYQFIKFLKHISKFTNNSEIEPSFEKFEVYIHATDYNYAVNHFSEFYIGIERLTNKLISIQYLIRHSNLSINERIIVLNDLTYSLGNLIPNDFRIVLATLSKRGEDGFILEKYNHPKLKLVRYFYRTAKLLFDEWEKVNSSIYKEIGDYDLNT
ncbi:MAG: hypothetical protein IPP69_11465 [Flavobacteriales bacterium]|nr:hypothetical protein [Flavobacteriales bacterium]